MILTSWPIGQPRTILDADEAPVLHRPRRPHAANVRPRPPSRAAQAPLGRAAYSHATGHGDIGMAVSAIQAGALDFLEKPFPPERLVDAVRMAVDKTQHRWPRSRSFTRLAARVNELSGRQRQVHGSRRQGTSPTGRSPTRSKSAPRTVETYRAWVMEKTGAQKPGGAGAAGDAS